MREDDRVIAYLFGFWSQTEPIGYIHLVGVRRTGVVSVDNQIFSLGIDPKIPPDGEVVVFH